MDLLGVYRGRQHLYIVRLPRRAACTAKEPIIALRFTWRSIWGSGEVGTPSPSEWPREQDGGAFSIPHRSRISARCSFLAVAFWPWSTDTPFTSAVLSYHRGVDCVDRLSRARLPLAPPLAKAGESPQKFRHHHCTALLALPRTQNRAYAWSPIHRFPIRAYSAPVAPP